MFILSPDLVVLHALPGFWHPDDLARELRFAKVLGRLWEDDQRPREEKDDMFRRLQLAELRRQPAETFARSTWQGFDARVENQKLEQDPTRDTFLFDRFGNPLLGAYQQPQMKPINMLVHERMAERPFVAYEDFDIEEFIDYGKLHYDNNHMDNGKQFPGQMTLMGKRMAEERREAQRQARLVAQAEARRKARWK